MLRWSKLLEEAYSKGGSSLRSALQYAERLEAAGFVDVHKVKKKWPINSWEEDGNLNSLGKLLAVPPITIPNTLGLWSFFNTMNALEGLTMRPFTRCLDWKPEEVQVLLALVRKALRDKRTHAYWPV